PCLRLAYDTARAEQTYPAALNAADEVAVDAFLDGRLRFLEIPRVLETVLERHEPRPDDTLENILAADRWARTEAAAVIEEMRR
ncbi:MAG: 1-deoxy-D-xylulose-5-phosphate reductoisomerase, partial [Armatimonadetes bacterium]|nr:1-deoxy-D-xylulose-5-phosphate reductoisomerase [Armatimonadota bacterium]